MQKKTNTLHISVSNKKNQRLRKRADMLGITVAALVNICITEYFERLQAEMRSDNVEGKNS